MARLRNRTEQSEGRRGMERIELPRRRYRVSRFRAALLASGCRDSLLGCGCPGLFREEDRVGPRRGQGKFGGTEVRVPSPQQRELAKNQRGVRRPAEADWTNLYNQYCNLVTALHFLTSHAMAF